MSALTARTTTDRAMPTASVALETFLPKGGERPTLILQRTDVPPRVRRHDLARRRAVALVNLMATAVIASALTMAVAPATGRWMAQAASTPSFAWMLALAAVSGVALTAGRHAWRLQAEVVELRRDLAAARETERWHRTVVNEVVDGVLVASPEGRLVEANHAACVLLGRTREQLTGQRLWDLIPFDDRVIALRRHQQLVTSGGGLRRLLRPDGSAVLADVSWSALPDGRVVYLAREWHGGR